MEVIISSTITGGLALAGVIITNLSSNKRIEHRLDKQQAITDTKLEELTREVRLHNNFAQKVPLIEERINIINHELEALENKIKN